ncbi:MAG TPA: hypothetical protein VFX20_23475 [Steroidobacteraceae bacterium]|nr:hypothetical protein [Steroidobacteraceae bacterium]
MTPNELLQAASLASRQPVSPAGSASLVQHLLHWVLGLAGSAALFVAYEHLKLNGQAMPAYACLAGSALLVLNPLKATVHRVLSIERGVMHLVHAVGGLGLIALPVTGAVTGTPVLTRAALAPFAIMGAAQAVMHQNHPRNAAQAAALRNFASSLPEVEQFAGRGDFTSPANVARAVRVLTDLLSKAQALGETELQSDPGFQSALKQVGVRTGLSLGLDAISHSIDVMAQSPSAAAAAPALRARLAQVRSSLAQPGRDAGG